MATTQQKLFAFLDSALGAGAHNQPEDFETRDDLMSSAIELVEEQDGLTQGCGVGPLMSGIKAWAGDFLSGERNNPSAEPFCLKIQFDPLRQGFVLAHDETQLRQHFPTPLELPQAYPVFARKVEAGLPVEVLSYLYYAEMTLVP